MSANFTKSLATNNYQVSKIDSTNGLLSFIELVANRLSIFYYVRLFIFFFP